MTRVITRSNDDDIPFLVFDDHLRHGFPSRQSFLHEVSDVKKCFLIRDRKRRGNKIEGHDERQDGLSMPLMYQ
jgi:hypothetical protein